MSDLKNRRPLKSRGSAWAQWLTNRLAKTSITPNQISQLSMVAAGISGALFYFSASAEGGLYLVLLLFAALFCQLRLLCNLMDGLVAVEAGKSAPDGPFWNEFPDRIADILILVGFGFAAGEPVLGWVAVSFAVLTAYTRELGNSVGFEADFSGPMAKPHRMATITIATVLALLASFWPNDIQILKIALWLVIIGAVITSVRRAMRIVKQLHNTH